MGFAFDFFRPRWIPYPTCLYGIHGVVPCGSLKEWASPYKISLLSLSRFAPSPIVSGSVLSRQSYNNIFCRIICWILLANKDQMWAHFIMLGSFLSLVCWFFSQSNFLLHLFKCLIGFLSQPYAFLHPQSQILRCSDMVLCPKVDFSQLIEAEDLVFLSFIQTCFIRIWKTAGPQFTTVFSNYRQT